MDASVAGLPDTSQGHNTGPTAVVPGVPSGQGWLVLRDCPLGGGGPRVGLALLHPKIGVALVDFAPTAADAADRLRRALDDRRFPAIFGGYPPVVRVILPEEQLPDLGPVLSAGFRAEAPFALNGGESWLPSARAALEAGPAPAAPKPPKSARGDVPPLRAAALILGAAASSAALMAAVVMPWRDAPPPPDAPVAAATESARRPPPGRTAAGGSTFAAPDAPTARATPPVEDNVAAFRPAQPAAAVPAVGGAAPPADTAAAAFLPAPPAAEVATTPDTAPPEAEVATTPDTAPPAAEVPATPDMAPPADTAAAYRAADVGAGAPVAAPPGSGGGSTPLAAVPDREQPDPAWSAAPPAEEPREEARPAPAAAAAAPPRDDAEEAQPRPTRAAPPAGAPPRTPPRRVAASNDRREPSPAPGASAYAAEKRCRDILVKTSLGEGLSNVEKDYLRRGCGQPRD